MWPSARQVPMNPAITVIAMQAAVVPITAPGMKVQSARITWTMTAQAAAVPITDATMAVTKPSSPNSIR